MLLYRGKVYVFSWSPVEKYMLSTDRSCDLPAWGSWPRAGSALTPGIRPGQHNVVPGPEEQTGILQENTVNRLAKQQLSCYSLDLRMLLCACSVLIRSSPLRFLPAGAQGASWGAGSSLISTQEEKAAQGQSCSSGGSKMSRAPVLAWLGCGRAPGSQAGCRSHAAAVSSWAPAGRVA